VGPLVPFRADSSITARSLLDGAVVLPRCGNEVLVRDMGRLAALSEVRLPRQQVLVLGRFFVENIHRLDTVSAARLTCSARARSPLREAGRSDGIAVALGPAGCGSCPLLRPIRPLPPFSTTTEASRLGAPALGSNPADSVTEACYTYQRSADRVAVSPFLTPYLAARPSSSSRLPSSSLTAVSLRSS
jgi:hypothetical protein